MAPADAVGIEEAGAELLEDRPPHRVVGVVEDVEIGRGGLPREGGDTVGRRVDRLVDLAGQDLAPTGGGVVEGVELGRERLGPAGGGVDVHPDGDGVDHPAGVAQGGDAALGPAAAEPGAEGGQLETLAEGGGAALLDDRAAHDPVLGVGEAGVVGVVAADVLQIAGDRVEAEPTSGIDVAQAHPPTGAEHPAGAGTGRSRSPPLGLRAGDSGLDTGSDVTGG